MMTAKMNDVCVCVCLMYVCPCLTCVCLTACVFVRSMVCLWARKLLVCTHVSQMCVCTDGRLCVCDQRQSESTITPVSLRVDYIIEPLSKGVQFNLKDIIFRGAAILIKQGE